MITIVRLVIVLGGGLIATALLLQNQTPLAVSILGTQFPTLSLGLLILLACGLGILTGIGFHLLLNKFQSMPAKTRPRSRVRKTSTKAQKASRGSGNGQKFWSRSQPAAKATRSGTKSKSRQGTSQGVSDWYTPPQPDWIPVSATEYDSRSPQEEDWAYDGPPPRANKRSFSDFFQRSPRANAEVDESFESRRADRSQKVVDAEYRVLNSPNSSNQSSSAPPRRSGDEWDDEFFDED